MSTPAKSTKKVSLSKAAQKKQPPKQESSISKNPKQKPVEQVPHDDDESGWTNFGGGFGTKWQPHIKKMKHPDTLLGIVTSKRDMPADGKKFLKDGGFLEIATADGMSWSVGKSAAIAGWYTAIRVGDEVRIKFTGMVPMSGRPEPMKGFECAINTKARK